MKKFLILITTLFISCAANAQLIYGNTFPFWNVTGDLTVGGNASVTGTLTLTAAPTFSSLTASRAVFTDASKGLVSNAITGSGNVVMSASPTLTGTISAAALTLSGDMVVSTSGSPASNAACTAGKVIWDASYIYVCTATGVWKRAALTGGY